MAAADNIRIESTTDTVDAGLVDGSCAPPYQAAQPGDTFSYHAVGTGAALTNARNGLADVVITHAPLLEAQFVDDGYSLGLGRQIFYSDYVIVGPQGRPGGRRDQAPARRGRRVRGHRRRRRGRPEQGALPLARGQLPGPTSRSR